MASFVRPVFAPYMVLFSLLFGTFQTSFALVNNQHHGPLRGGSSAGTGHGGSSQDSRRLLDEMEKLEERRQRIGTRGEEMIVESSPIQEERDSVYRVSGGHWRERIVMCGCVPRLLTFHRSL